MAVTIINIGRCTYYTKIKKLLLRYVSCIVFCYGFKVGWENVVKIVGILKIASMYGI